MKAHDVPRVHRSRPLAVPTAQDVFHFCTVVQQCAHVLLFLSSGCNSTSEWCSPQPRSKPHLALDSWRACEAHTKRKATNTDIFWEYETLRNIRRLKPCCTCCTCCTGLEQVKTADWHTGRLGLRTFHGAKKMQPASAWLQRLRKLPIFRHVFRVFFCLRRPAAPSKQTARVFDH